MIQKLVFSFLVCISLITAYFPRPVPALAASDVIYDDSLAQGWKDWSWTSVNFASSTPVYSGGRSIAVTFGAWDGLYLYYPELSTRGFSYLRFYLHGGTSGGQRVNLYLILISNGAEISGPKVSLPLPAASTWTEYRVPLAELGATNAAIAGIIWQGATDGRQSTLYLDEIALVSDESPDGPQLQDGFVWPRGVPADGRTGVVVRVRLSDPQGLQDIASVTLALSDFGGDAVSLRDDGRSNDGLANDGVFGGWMVVTPGTSSGEKTLLVNAWDRAGHMASLQLGAFVVLAAPGGGIPAGLPTQIGWGTNTWSETPGEDWQVNSGVPWDYVYQYVTYHWYDDGWGGNFVRHFVDQAWSKDYIPMVVIYFMLGLPPTCGESSTCYAQKLQDSKVVQTYLAALEQAAREAQGAQPVIFNLEPDFYGYMQQYTNSQDRPSSVHPDDPTSIPVALNIPGYPNSLVGFGRRMVDLIRQVAPNILIAPMANIWGTHQDPFSVPSAEVVNLARRTAAFIGAMGGDQADLLVVEWGDRDAGSGLEEWWDESNQEIPRPTRLLLWENALSVAAQKRLVVWQFPVGNMSLNNTCERYQDNRAAYIFRHSRDLVDAGVIAVLFGNGTTCMTKVTTDGGFVANQGKIIYAPPAAPVGLTVARIQGSFIALHWIENTEPDLWGYQVIFQPTAGGPAVALQVGRKNSVEFFLPKAGTWIIQVEAYDAMGTVGIPSALVQVTASKEVLRLFLPVVQH